jgi:hypothetical protein
LTVITCAPATGQGVEIGRQRGHQGFAFTGFHLGDLPAVQHHAADDLNIIVAHLQGVQDVYIRIDLNAVEAHFVVQVGAGASARVAHFGNDLASLDLLSTLANAFVQVSVAGSDAVTVVNHQHVAEISFFTQKGNDAVGSGHDGGALAVGNVPAFVELLFTSKGRYAVAEG